MEVLTKLELAATVSAVNAVISSAPHTLSNDNPLVIAAKKLEKNLEEFYEEEIRRATK